MDDTHEKYQHRPGTIRIALGLPVSGEYAKDAAPVQKVERAESGMRVTVMDYCPEQIETKSYTNVSEFLPYHRPAWSKVRWINVDGLRDAEAVRAIAKKYELHPLVIEDVLNQNHRPKAEDYKGAAGQADRLFVIARMLHIEEGYLYSEQISFFLGRTTLLTFQDEHGDVFDPIRERLQKPDSNLRKGDASALLYTQLDTIVDHIFPILEVYSERLEELEEAILSNPQQDHLKAVHQTKRELLVVRRAAWPMREVIHQLQREPHCCLSETTQVYFRDIYDHIIQCLDLIETYREFAAGLTEAYMSAVSNRMNEIMKTLTIISTIFVPLTFIAGVYGMNMPIPENKYPETYYAFWALSILITAAMLIYFKKRKWF